MTTNCLSTLISISPETTTTSGTIPPTTATPTVAAHHSASMGTKPYQAASDGVLFGVHALRAGRVR
jgi:hypothetical protein